MKKYINTLLICLFLMVLVFPLVSTAQGTGIIYDCNPPGQCTLDDLIRAVRSVLNWGTIFAIQFSVVVIAYAGFKYMSSGGNPGERSKANAMLWKVCVGIFFIVTAWVIVTFILNALAGGNVPRFLG